MKNRVLSIIAIVLSLVSLAGYAVSYVSSELEVIDLDVSSLYEDSGIALYVSVSGSDSGAGTRDRPLKTLMGAFERIKALKPEIEEINAAKERRIDSITVYMEGGRYPMDAANYVKVDGTFFPSGVKLSVKAMEGQTPILDGGMRIDAWEKATLNGNQVLAARLDKNLDGIYSLNVNGKNAELANSMSSPDFEGCNLSNQNRKKHSYIDNEGSFTWTFADPADIKQGIRVTSNTHVLSKLVSPAQAQAVWLIEWKEFIIKLDKLEQNTIRSNYWNVIASVIELADHADWFWPNPIHNFYLQNDISLINRPGEFCYDRTSGILYYYPLEGQNADNIDAYIPLTSKLMDLSTTVKKGLISDLTFEGISFANTCVDYIDKLGGVAINQAQQFDVSEAQAQGNGWTTIRDEMDSAITLNYCQNVTFRNCDFINLGLTAVKLEVGCQNCKIEGCLFKELGNSAVVISTPNGYSLTAASRSVNNTIENCVIRRIGQINNSAPALMVYYSENTTIMHNDIYDCPYTAISMGWGWTSVKDSYANSNHIAFNRIGNYLRKLKDGGGIYTLNMQPYSTIEYNFLFSQNNNYAAIYLDEGTSGYTVSNNAVYLNGLLDDRGEFMLDEDGDPIDRFYKESENLTWFYLHDATAFAGTADSPVKDIQVVSNYFCCGNGYGKTLAHPDNIIPPIQNDDAAHPEKRNVEFADYDSFRNDVNVKTILSMAGVEAEYAYLLNK